MEQSANLANHYARWGLFLFVWDKRVSNLLMSSDASHVTQVRWFNPSYPQVCMLKCPWVHSGAQISCDVSIRV